MTTSNRPPLSPAAQAVLDAWLKSEKGERMLGDPACLAVALRAVADQVIEEVSPIEALLTIAAELDPQP